MSLPIDLMFGGQRIQLRSGTTDPKLVADLKAMLRVFYQHRRVWFDAIVNGYPILDAWGYYVTGKLPAMPESPEGALQVKPLWESWAASAKNRYGKPVSEAHRRNHGQALAYLTRAGARIVADLPSALMKLRDTLAPDHPTSFMMTKASAMSFCRDMLIGKREGQFYRACRAVESVTLKRNVAKALPVEEFRERVSQLPEPYRSMAWDLATTGMGPKEYMVDGFKVLRHGIQIHGVKRESRERIIPLIRPPLGPKWGYAALWLHFKRANLTPYQCRRCYIRWLGEAGLAAFWQDYYAGHAPRGETGLYQESEPTVKELEAHAKVLKAFIGPESRILSITRRA